MFLKALEHSSFSTAAAFKLKKIVNSRFRQVLMRYEFVSVLSQLDPLCYDVYMTFHYLTTPACSDNDLTPSGWITLQFQYVHLMT